MPEEKRTYEADTFYLQNADLRPRQQHGGRSSGVHPSQGRPDSDPGEAPGLPRAFNRHTILRLIQILKEK